MTGRLGGGIKIRRVGPEDSGLFGRVAADVFDEKVDADRLAAFLAEPGHYLMVAIASGEIVGQLAAIVHRHPDKPPELYIDEVGIAPAFQRQGIAATLLNAVLELGRALGCEEAWVGTEPDNLPARKLYERAGAEAQTFLMYVFDLKDD